DSSRVMSSEAPDSRAELSVDPEIVSTRVLPAGRTTVFQAFLEPDALASWWGPAGFTNEFHSFEPRPGGSWTFTMHGPDGASHAMVKEFEKVQPSETIVIRHLEPPEHRFRLAMTFAEATGGTTLLT